jgi:hypothetical protein
MVGLPVDFTEKAAKNYVHGKALSAPPAARGRVGIHTHSIIKFVSDKESVWCCSH